MAYFYETSLLHFHQNYDLDIEEISSREKRMAKHPFMFIIFVEFLQKFDSLPSLQLSSWLQNLFPAIAKSTPSNSLTIGFQAKTQSSQKLLEGRWVMSRCTVSYEKTNFGKMTFIHSWLSTGTHLVAQAKGPREIFGASQAKFAHLWYIQFCTP